MTFEEFITAEKERDPEFRREWEAGEPEFQIISALVGARSRLGWTQTELARRMGTDQPAISRAESTGKVTPEFLARFAVAVGGGATLTVQLPGKRLSFRLDGTPPTKKVTMLPLTRSENSPTHKRRSVKLRDHRARRLIPQA